LPRRVEHSGERRRFSTFPPLPAAGGAPRLNFVISARDFLRTESPRRCPIEALRCGQIAASSVLGTLFNESKMSAYVDVVMSDNEQTLLQDDTLRH